MRLAHQQMVWLEAHRHPILDVVFKSATSLGSEGFLLLFVALGYWLVHRPIFARAAGMLVVAAMLNTLLKGVFEVPRPIVSHLVEADGWSFPSGHAQTAAAFWGWLAVEVWRVGFQASKTGSATLLGRFYLWISIGLWALAALVAASRPYLGVHFPHDVVVGYAIGAFQVLVLFLMTRGREMGDIPRRFRRVLWVAGGLLVILTIAILKAPTLGFMARLLGVSFGLGAGVSWAAWMGWMDTPKNLISRGGLCALGLVGLFGVWLGLKALFVTLGWGEDPGWAAGRYLLLGFWISVGVPAIASFFPDESPT